MLELGYKITALDEVTFEEIMEAVAFTRDEAEVLIKKVADIEGLFPMVVYGIYENNN
jgi:hypothetical protein